MNGDVTKIDSRDIPDFDFLLAGFPCQPFSAAGNRKGFLDTRGTLFFEIERILKEKKPQGFLLENVEGLVNHDKIDPKAKMGRTLETILTKLDLLEYKTSWKVLDSSEFGVPQKRKRIYIVGHKKTAIDLENFPKTKSKLDEILEKGLDVLNTPFTNKLLSKFNVKELYGKSIKDKRGGNENIHSWELELKGSVSKFQSELLNILLKERRKKIWAVKKGIHWMDGMSLTLAEIQSFLQPNLFQEDNLKSELDDLVTKGYLVFEHPKDLNSSGIRDYRYDLEPGYNIVSGKLSFEISKILDPNGISPTLVATDIEKIAIPDINGVRRLTTREGLRLFGFPEDFRIDVKKREAYDLLGNTVVVTVVQKVAERILQSIASM